MSELIAKGHRMSKLPIVQYCGLAGALSEESGSIRAGVMSKWFHASCGEQWDEAQRLWMQLTDEEREEVKYWNPPATCTVDSNILEYKDAEKELEVAIDENGLEVASGEAMSIGHLDMAWVGTVSNGKRAFIGDIKRSRFTVRDGTNSLQLHAYGFSFASARMCNSYRVGIWSAIDGLWIWGDAAVDLESSLAADIWSRIRGAALNTNPEANKGSHCQDCWGRMRCPAYLLPAALASKEELAPLTGVGPLTPERALKALQLAEAMDDLAGSVIATCKAYVNQGGKIIDSVSGTEYRPVKHTGRESVKVEAVRAKYGSSANDIIKRGKDYDAWGWQKSKVK